MNVRRQDQSKRFDIDLLAVLLSRKAVEKRNGMMDLTPNQQKLIQAQIAAGQFKEPGEVIDAALELLTSRQREHDQLQPAMEQILRGEVSPLDFQTLQQEIDRRLEQQDPGN